MRHQAWRLPAELRAAPGGGASDGCRLANDARSHRENALRPRGRRLSAGGSRTKDSNWSTLLGNPSTKVPNPCAQVSGDPVEVVGELSLVISAPPLVSEQLPALASEAALVEYLPTLRSQLSAFSRDLPGLLCGRRRLLSRRAAQLAAQSRQALGAVILLFRESWRSCSHVMSAFSSLPYSFQQRGD